MARIRPPVLSAAPPKKVRFHGELITPGQALRAVQARLRIARAAGIVAPRFAVPVEYVTGPRPDGPVRRPNPEVEARALTAYLAHTSLGVSKKLIARVMQIEWSQLNRTINAIEDRREFAAFDGLVGELEAALDGEPLAPRERAAS